MTSSRLRISLSQFEDFLLAPDPAAQLTRVREIYRSSLKPYRPGRDYWSYFREGVEQVHRQGGRPTELDAILDRVPESRLPQYRSAIDGYRKFWGSREIVFQRSLGPAIWRSGRLEVKVNPEWTLGIGGNSVAIKLHLKRRYELDQRCANPVLLLLTEHFGPRVGGYPVGLVDVHRRKLWRIRRNSIDDVAGF
jgi:hypothetical protein